jgi:hypothetical protein
VLVIARALESDLAELAPKLQLYVTQLLVILEVMSADVQLTV